MTAAGIVGVAAGVGAAGSGAWAAWLWYRASNVTSVPDWGPGGFEPVDPQIGQMMWTGALLNGAVTSSKLNARAARWTGAAVALTAIQTVAGILAAGIP